MFESGEVGGMVKTVFCSPAQRGVSLELCLWEEAGEDG